MTHRQTKQERNSLRLKYFDYSKPGAYFVTICTKNRTCILGNIVKGVIKLNPAGEIVKEYWLKLSEKFKHIKVDEYVIMPNRIHGIIVLEAQDIVVGADPCVSPEKKKGKHLGLPLHRIIQWYKTMTSNNYFRLNRNVSSEKLWQRNYYEHIIRDEKDLNKIREYIINNPLQWELDKENPKNIKF